MVRARSLVIGIGLIMIAAALQSARAGADARTSADRSSNRTDASKPASASLKGAVSSAATETQAKPPETPIGQKPYRIRVWFEIDPSARLSEHGQSRLVAHWLALAKRFVGPPWDLTVETGAGPLAGKSIDALTAADFPQFVGDFDKVWVIAIVPYGSGYEMIGRECDVMTTRLAQSKRVLAPHPADAARALFQLALDLFAPTAEIGESKEGRVSVLVRGAELPIASPLGDFLKVGTVFRPLRIYQKPDNSILGIFDIAWTYLRVEQVTGSTAWCRIVSNQGDPLTKRAGRRNKIVALGVKPANVPVKLQFVTKPDKKPAGGYVITAQAVPDGRPRFAALTDRQGRAEVEPIPGQGLIILHLMGGDNEPLADMPVMPGEVRDVRPIMIDAKYQTVAMEAELSAIRDELLDQIVIRKRLEKFMQAREAGDQWDEVEKLLKEYDDLPTKASFAERVQKLKDDAERRQSASKPRVAILTRNARNMITETQAMIDGYLDDDIFKAYAEAVTRYKAGERNIGVSGGDKPAPAPGAGGAGRPPATGGAYAGPAPTPPANAAPANSAPARPPAKSPPANRPGGPAGAPF